MIVAGICVLTMAERAIGQSERDSAAILQDDSYVERMQEEILEETQESEEENQTSALVSYYRRHPVDLNRASLLDLENIPGLSPVLAKTIHDHGREKPFARVSDLMDVEGMTEEMFRMIQGMVTVGRRRLPRTSLEFRQRTVRSLDMSFDEYRGNPYQVYHRLEGQYRLDENHPNRELGAGIVLEKDAGETRWNDHGVAYVEVRHFPFIRHAVAGHHQLEFGQGLVLWSGRGAYKGSEVIRTSKKTGRGIHPFSYASEYGAMWGGAIRLDLQGADWLKRLEPTIFYSRTGLDATFDGDGTIRSLQVDGLHRDSAELSREHAVHEQIVGANVETRFGPSSCGVTWYESEVDRRFALTDTVRNRYDFAGRRQRLLGFHFDVFVGNLNAFGEAAADRRGHTAFNSGFIWAQNRMEGSLFYRRYSKAFQNLHASGWGEQRGTRNEEGLYVGLGWRPRRSTRIRMYYDLYRTLWRTYDIPKRAYGDDVMLQWDQKMAAGLWLICRIQNERQDVAVSTTDMYSRDIKVVEQSGTRRARVQLDWEALRTVQLKSRIEGVAYRVPGHRSLNRKGSSLCQDIRWSATPRITVYGRWTVFDAEGSSAAIYEYEHDVEGAMTNSMWSDRGSRWYVAVRLRWNKRMTMAGKYGEKAVETEEGGFAVIRRVAFSVSYGM